MKKFIVFSLKFIFLMAVRVGTLILLLNTIIGLFLMWQLSIDIGDSSLWRWCIAGATSSGMYGAVKMYIAGLRVLNE